MADKLSNTLSDHIANININKQITLSSISNDLNNAKSPGIVIYNNSESASVSNIPLSGNGGYVLVFTATDSDIIQIYFRRNVGGPGKIYARLYITNAWTPWVTVLNS